jgi:hypothetical protein
MGFGLLNSLFVWGFLAVSIPIIIHLLFKRQYKTIQWAAIQFLLEAEKRIRKKFKLIELLLLFLRCLAIFLLVLLFGKLFLDKSGAFDKYFGGKPVFYHVVIDDSPSMNFKADDSSPFQKSVFKIKGLINDLCQKNEESFLSLYLTSNIKSPVFKKVLLNRDNFSKFKIFFDKISTNDVPINPEYCLSEVKRQIDEEKDPCHHILKIYSDFRDSDWNVLNSDQLKKNLEATLGSAENISFIDSGSKNGINLGITNIKISEKKVVANVPLKFTVEITNFSNLPQKNIEIVMIPNSGVKMKRVIAEIISGGKESVTFSYSFNAVGSFDLQWQINADGMLEDNNKNLSVEVDSGSRILIVDGDPDHASNQSETKYLLTALAPPGDTFSGNQVDRKTESEFEIASLEDYEIIYLCNLYRVIPQKIQQLTSWVAAGGSLVITLGDQVDSNFYNEFLYLDNKGLLGGKLSNIKILNPDEKGQFGEINFLHPIFSSFSNDASKFIFNANFYGWWKIDKKSIGENKILASFNDEDKSPAFIEKQFQRGKTFLFTSTIDDDWNSWPSEFSFLITQLEIVKYCLKDKSKANLLIAGEKIKMNLATSKFKNKIMYLGSDKKQNIPINSVTNNSDDLDFMFSETLKTGFYHFESTSLKEVKEIKSFSVNVKSDEGMIDKNNLPMAINKLSMPNINYYDISNDSQKNGSDLKNEYWKSILMMLVGILLIESTTAWYFGGKR